MRWKITPFIGVGDLHLGMSPSQVASILGQEVHFTTPIKNGSFNEHREGKLPVCNYKDDILRSIDIYADIYDLEFDDLLLFQEEPRQVIRHLESVAGAPSITFGICFFKKDRNFSWEMDQSSNFSDKSAPRPRTRLKKHKRVLKGSIFRYVPR